MLFAFALCPRAAAAQTELAADGGFGLPISAHYAAPGPVFGLRLGRRVRMPGAWEVFELGVVYGRFSPSTSNTAPGGIDVFRGIAGMRIGFAGIVQPGLFAHVGVGHVGGNLQETNAGQLVSNSDFSHTSLTWDAGAYLDLQPAKILSLGAHASYNQIVESGGKRSFQWLDLGGHLTLWL